MRTRRIMAVAGLLVAAATTAGRAEGYRTTIGPPEARIPVVVVRGTPYEMGFALGKLTAPEARKLVTSFLQMVQSEGSPRFQDEALDAAWAKVSPHMSPRFVEELKGLADGIGLPFDAVRRAHMVPVVSDYACSSIAAWGKATKDGHLYQTRNLDWILEAHAHDLPCVIVYHPKDGIPHVNVSFAGYIGVNTGINAQGIVLSEMGDSPKRDYPFNLDGAHFTHLFRDILQDCDSIDAAVDRIKSAQRIKKYHYVVGDGQAPRAVKMKAHAPDLVIWNDNDPTDELAPRVLDDVVYQDEGRGAFEPLKQAWGRIDAETLKGVACAIPIKGGNVLDVVYDATACEFWVSYARGETEAYLRPFVHVRMADYLTYDPSKSEAAWPAAPAAAASR